MQGSTPKDENRLSGAVSRGLRTPGYLSAPLQGLRRRLLTRRGKKSLCFRRLSEAAENINKKTFSRHPAWRI